MPPGPAPVHVCIGAGDGDGAAAEVELAGQQRHGGAADQQRAEARRVAEDLVKGQRLQWMKFKREEDRLGQVWVSIGVGVRVRMRVRVGVGGSYRSRNRVTMSGRVRVGVMTKVGSWSGLGLRQVIELGCLVVSTMVGSRYASGSGPASGQVRLRCPSRMAGARAAASARVIMAGRCWAQGPVVACIGLKGMTTITPTTI